MSERPDRDGEPTEGPESEEVEELLEELEELEETAETPDQRRVIQQTIDLLDRLPGGRTFGVDDLAQQVVGGFILSAPFVVTEEVWSLAGGMSTLQWGVTVVMVVLIGYGTLYGADEERAPDREGSVAGLPVRFLSLMAVSYLSVATLALVFNAPVTFGAGVETTVRAVSIGAIFSVVGAATADSVFG
jgi:uncharacterized membrane protein